jgi:hypothetical protein
MSLAALAVAVSTGILGAQKGFTYRAAPIEDLGVQRAVKVAFDAQKVEENGMIVFSSLVSAEGATVDSGTRYRLCLSVARGKPLERAVAIVHRDLQWQLTLVSWTYTSCEAPRPAAG